MNEQLAVCEGTLTLRNSLPSQVVVRLEPWADEIPVETGNTVDIAFSGPSGGQGLEIEVSQNEITIYGWEGATLSPLCNEMASESSRSEICAGKLTLRNSLPSQVVVRLEPWADEVPVETGTTVDIAFSGPSGGQGLEIEVSQGEITAYGWEGAVLSALSHET